MRLVAGFAVKLRNHDLNWIASYPSFAWTILMNFVLRSTPKATVGHRMNWGNKTPLDFHYGDDLRILDENISTMHEFLEILKV